MTDHREVLYTINAQGERQWVYPSVVKGRWFRPRQAVAYLLMAIYLLMPWLVIDGKQAVYLDILNRKFTFFGETFWATDGGFLFIVLAGLGIALFFFTAVFGRVWCGWACPETVFLEFLFRPIERLIEGSPSKMRRLDAGPWTKDKIFKKALKFFAFAVVAWILASTALAYFVGRERLLGMMLHSPAENPFLFGLTIILMGLLVFQFGWFREQFCTVVCPYARFQSVLLDPHSLVVGYDADRGELRRKLSRSKEHQTEPEAGDCIDCGLCVRVCPTGIDIRNGLQLECIHCTACIDACDSVMEKIGRPLGLIRYDTEEGLETGAKIKWLRGRVLAYAFILVVLTGAFIYMLSARQLSEFQIIRGPLNKPFHVLADGLISNHLHARVSNKGDESASYSFELVNAPDVTLIVPTDSFPVPAGEIRTSPIFLNLPENALKDGKRVVTVRIRNDRGYTQTQSVTILGPG